VSARVALRSLAYALLLFACQCGASGPPSALDRYRESHEISLTTQWSSPGLRFYRVSELGVQDRSSTSIVAVDASGTLIEGAELFAHFASLPPDELAAHACFTLIDGCAPLTDHDPDGARWLDGDASRVRAPHREGDRLVFDIVEGDMAPRVMRMTIDVPSGTIVSRDALREPAPATLTIAASIFVTLGIGGATPHYVTATYAAGAVNGCVSNIAGTCLATVLATLDVDAQRELEQLLGEVAAIPRCEPDGVFADDLAYSMSWEGAPREYTGAIPSNESQMSARNGGPCRADARLAWWIARWVLAQSRPPSELPTIVANVDVSTASEPRFVNATARIGESSCTIVGCVTSDHGGCHATTTVVLDAVQSTRLRALVEDVRAEPCHVPFPTSEALDIDAGIDYDGRCPADPALGLWIARTLVPPAP